MEFRLGQVSFIWEIEQSGCAQKVSEFHLEGGYIDFKALFQRFSDKNAKKTENSAQKWTKMDIWLHLTRATLPIEKKNLAENILNLIRNKVVNGL